MFESEDNIFLNQAPDSLISVEEVLADGGQMHHSVLESAGPVKPALRLLSALFMVGVFIIAGRVYDLQVAKGSVYRGLAEDNRVRLIQNFAPRGLIVDRYGQVIARNTPSFALAVIPHDLPQDEGAKESLLNLAAQISGANLEEMKEKLAEADNTVVEPISIAENLPQDKALALEDFVAKNPSFQIQNKPIREYIDGPVYAALLGYVGKINNNEWSEYKSRGYSLNDSVGKTGIEIVYENVLHGKNGGTEVEVDAMGKVTKKLRDVEPKPGADVRLTIDAGLQKVIYDSLFAMLAKRPQAFGAAAIAQDAKTGEVLAMVSLPTYDNNLFARGISGTDYKRLAEDRSKPMLNRVIGGAYPPGSTAKSITAAAGLQEGVITDKTIINDEGSISVGPYVFYGWDRGGLGKLDVYGALAMSSDPFFYTVGGGYAPYNIEGLGAVKLSNYLKYFGLGEKLGINLPGEVPGRVPTPEWKKQHFSGQDALWYLGDTYHLAIGQGDLLVTPLQLNSFMVTIANGGKIQKPFLNVLDKPEVISTVPVDAKNMAIVQEGLRQNVTEGTGTRIGDLSIPVSGKTGTAQFDASGDLHRTHAWYTAYAPSNDPQIVITVLVENGGEGGGASLPVVRDALKWWSENRFNK